jgi:acetoin utilization deacetylase AcuC-like enzyme
MAYTVSWSDMTGRVEVFWDERMLEHDAGPGHPEHRGRLEAIVCELQRVGAVAWRSPRLATAEEILRVHDEAHLARIEAVRGRTYAFDPDTQVSPQSVPAAYLAAGAAVGAVEAVCAATDEGPALALCRPPGHHAERHQAMGFCLFNNIAVAAAHARARCGCERVMIIDWDVHHGNGTQHIFEDDPDVLFVSSHRWPFFPGTGAAQEVGTGAGRGATVNLPLAAGTGDDAIVALYRETIPSLAEAFAPEIILVSAGFDAHMLDPLGGLRVTELGFAALCEIVRDAARRHANGRIALVLEGGYHLGATAASVRACVEVLASDA